MLLAQRYFPSSTNVLSLKAGKHYFSKEMSNFRSSATATVAVPPPPHSGDVKGGRWGSGEKYTKQNQIDPFDYWHWFWWCHQQKINWLCLTWQTSWFDPIYTVCTVACICTCPKCYDFFFLLCLFFLLIVFIGFLFCFSPFPILNFCAVTEQSRLNTKTQSKDWINILRKQYGKQAGPTHCKQSWIYMGHLGCCGL